MLLVFYVPNYYYYFLFECWTLYVKNHRNNLRLRMMLTSYKENLHVLLTGRDCWNLHTVSVCRRANLLLIHLMLMVLPWYLWCCLQSMKDLLRPPLGNLWTSIFVPVVLWGCPKSCSFFHLSVTSEVSRCPSQKKAPWNSCSPLLKFIFTHILLQYSFIALRADLQRVAQII